MADLSAYISFLVELDIRNKSLPVIKLTDNSAYPVGVAAGVSGIFEITQPDGGVYSGSWSTPDIVYSAGILQPASISLRLATNNKLQPGNYTIKYTVDHAGYTPTTLTRTFTVSYSAPVISIEKSFDVFTPVISVADSTVYTTSGFTVGSVTRAWSVNVGTTGTLTGTGSSLQLDFSGDYYDALYDITLTSTFLCASNSYNFLSIRDSYVTHETEDAYAPPSGTQLLTYLKELKSRLDALINTCQRYDKAKQDYEYAVVLYTHLKNRVCSGDTVNVYTYVQEILDILHYHNSISQVHSNTAIDPYNFTQLCGTGSGGTIEYHKYIVDGSETLETTPFNHITFVIPELVGKTMLQFSLDGIIREHKNDPSPIEPALFSNKAVFESAAGKIYYTPGLDVGQLILILYK